MIVVNINKMIAKEEKAEEEKKDNRNLAIICSTFP